jgi:hypothetical protein
VRVGVNRDREEQLRGDRGDRKGETLTREREGWSVVPRRGRGEEEKGFHCEEIGRSRERFGDLSQERETQRETEMGRELRDRERERG